MQKEKNLIAESKSIIKPLPAAVKTELVEYDSLPIYLQVLIGKFALDNDHQKDIIRISGIDLKGDECSEIVYASNCIEAVQNIVTESFLSINCFERLELVDSTPKIIHDKRKLNFVISNLDGSDFNQDISVLSAEASEEWKESLQEDTKTTADIEIENKSPIQ